MAWDRDKERKAGKAMTLGSCIYGLIFSIVWCGIAVWMGAYFMLIFGIPFVGMMIYRLYILLQMTKEDKTQKQAKEADPWDRPAATREPPHVETAANGYCPYCGSAVQETFEFCPKCGRRLK